MSDLAERYKLVEDWLCDTIDEITGDGIPCAKEFEPSEPECRAIFLSSTRRPADDQSYISVCSVNFKSVSPSRSKALLVVGALNKGFPIYSRNIGNQLVISIVPSYITMPIKTVVDAQKRYIVSASFTATIT